MAIPTEYPLWSTLLANEVKTIDGKQVTVPNRATVPVDYSNDGILYGETIHRQYINQVLYLCSQWVQHLDTRMAVGHIHLDFVAVTVGDLATRFGGTWQAEGTQAVGTIATAYVYRKIA